MAADLLTRDPHRARIQVLTGPASLRLRDLVAVVADVLGRPIAIDPLTPEQAVLRRPAWLPEPVLRTLLAAEAAAVGVPAPVNNTVERATGRPPRAFRDWVAANRADFAAA
ncbi:Rossmann-fold NAD(P)-binding domain-containing protein [Actinokineospora iranica]|uniref:Uncharacterized protein n=1 Tax=Actinokineospora iranica TaxID=1271860 RepID=A0A1G6U1I3_9PSEU|nr:hypothetical protein [Actinokineospora iranica]SDD35240.1 hypothetical protein SAMN05216174_11059 [Actinokineospora iranica]